MQTPFLDKFILGDKSYSSAELKEKFDNYDQAIKELQDPSYNKESALFTLEPIPSKYISIK